MTCARCCDTGYSYVSEEGTASICHCDAGKQRIKEQAIAQAAYRALTPDLRVRVAPVFGRSSLGVGPANG